MAQNKGVNGSFAVGKDKPIPNLAERTAPFPKQIFGENNPYFSNIVTVQYQNSLLRALIQRQRENAAIKRSFDNLGLSFDEDSPPQSVCNDLPDNKLCKRFYAAPAPDFSSENFQNQLPKTNIKTFEKPLNSKATPEKEDLYEWTDITCVNQKCRAVLIERLRYQIRKTVYAGDELKKGWLVKSIAPQGVILEKAAGLKKKVRPAPSSLKGGPVSPYFIKETGLSTAARPNPAPVAQISAPEELDGLLNNIEQEEFDENIILLE